MDTTMQYPIGKCVLPETLSADQRASAIDILAAFPQQLTAALEGYRPGGWPIRTLVHHVADSHSIAYSWMRLALTEEWPTVFAYNPEALAGLLDSRLAASVSAQLIALIHRRWVSTLRAVPEADWSARGYVHPESGRCALEQALAMYDWHSRHHLAHIVNARQHHGW
jgi:hypothetical protein